MFDPSKPQIKNLTARQIRILYNLHYIGEGPRVFFQDAIALVNEPSLESRQHLVAHLMREIDSAIRGVVKPLLNATSEKKKNGKCDRYEASIKETIEFLGIDPLSEVGKLWLQYGKDGSKFQLHKFAHRKDLTYRSFSDEFYREWQNFEVVLDEVLERFKNRYLHFVKEVETLSSLSVVSESDESKFRNTVAPGSPLFRIFIGKLSSAVWFNSLWRMNYFQFSEYEKNLLGELNYFYWSPLTYLNKLIELNECKKVWSVIESLPPFENFGLHQEITKLCLKMPEGHFLHWMEKELEWFRRSSQLEYINTDVYSEAIERVWNLGNEKFCFALLSSLLAVLPDPNWDYQKGRLQKENVPNLWRSPEPIIKLSEYNFLEILSYFVPILEKRDPLELIQILSNLLQNLLMFGIRNWEETEDPFLDDHSYITRPSIWDHPQNYNHKLSDKLVPLFRDAILRFINDKESFETIVEELKSKRCLLFQRFYVFVVGKFGRDQNPELFHDVLYNQIYAEDDSFGNEYYALLSQNYPHFTKEERERYLTWLDEFARALEKKYETEFKSEIPNAQIDLAEMYRPKNRLNLFYYRKLPAMQGFLPPDKEKYLEELKSLYSKSLVKPEFPHYHESSFGPISPLENKDISAFSNEELIQKMIEFRKEEDGWNEPSPEGFARQISRDVENNPFRYLESISKFCDDQIPIRYPAAILSGFRGALDNGKELDSEVLCQYLRFLFDLIKPKPIKESLHLQHTLASFLRTIFERKIINKIDFDRFEFLDWIKVLLESPSPEESYESQNEDFVFTGINSVRGNALHSLVYFLSDYFQKNLEGDASKVINDSRVQRVYSILETHLSGEYSSRKTDRSVLGQHFAFLYWLNSGWFHENGKLLLNENKDSSRAFFHTYIQYGGYSDSIYINYKEWFSETIDFLNELGDKVREDRGIRPLRIGELLLNLYGNEVISSYEDLILVKFFSLPQGFLKASAIRFLGLNVPKDQSALLLRTETLWRWRLENGPSAEEFEVFSGWIDRGIYSEQLIFETIKKVTTGSLKSYGMESYLRFIRENFLKSSLVSIQFINSVTQETSYYWNAKEGDDLWEILKLGISKDSDEAVREITEDVIHRLGSYGHFQFRELVGL